jgi:long-chain acyl-CoA synthetase
MATLQYTGGTTGMPKGAMMSHYNLVSNAIMNAIWFNWTKEEKVMGVTPLSHTWGPCVTVNSPFYVGATLFLVSRFDLEKVLDMVDKHKITVFYGVTTLFNMLINHPTIGDYDLSSLRCAKAGGMPIPGEVKKKWDKITGTELILGYGLTEASPETHDSPPERIKVGSIGIPLMDTDAKIVDVETGTKELAPGEEGELIIKGPQVMLGYWQRPEETRDTLRDDWLYTGDIARMDEEGYFYIVDRSKDMIKYKGYGVYPGEVENVLYMHPAIRECAVAGKPDAVAGELPKAYVVLKDGYSLTEEELIEFCKQRVSPFKRIREVQFVGEIPKTPVGKVLRRVLRDRERGK